MNEITTAVYNFLIGVSRSEKERKYILERCRTIADKSIDPNVRINSVAECLKRFTANYFATGGMDSLSYTVNQLNLSVGYRDMAKMILEKLGKPVSGYVYKLNFCIWERLDRSKFEGFCFQWQTPTMSCQAFDYLDVTGERIETGKYIGRRIQDVFIMEFNRSETWEEIKPNLPNIAAAVKR